jgi:uncharacterized protein (DUF433 family)
MFWAENRSFAELAFHLRHVASLFRKGVPEQEIAEDFPALSERDLAYARRVSRLAARGASLDSGA